MKIFWFCALLILPTAVSWAQSERGDTQKAEASKTEASVDEPTFHDHYMNLQHMQERLSQRSPEEQAKLQPRMERAEREACRQLSKERQERKSGRDYRREGGYQLEAFAQQFEQYCATLR